MSNDILNQIKDLVKTLNHHCYLYHTLDKPEISDQEYDKLYRSLVDLEKAYPQYVQKDSPTQKVGGRVKQGFKKVKHIEHMYSLDNIFNKEELYKFILDDTQYYCDPKLDGLALELVYKNNQLISASTRGDGDIGEDVLENVKTISNIPQTLKVNKTYPLLVVRGEVIIYKKEFNRINKELLAKNEKPFANARNAAAGSLRTLDPNITKNRNMSFIAYNIANAYKLFETHFNVMKFLNKVGFTIPGYAAIRDGYLGIWNYIEDMRAMRNVLEMDIDGIVIKINDLSCSESLGYTAHAPRGQIAYKFPAEQVETKVKDIIVQVGRTGVLTPVAILDPVSVHGVIVSKATLHNVDIIKNLDVRIGDTVILQRSGDVIPDIVSVVKSKRDHNSIPYAFPTTCPVCNSPVYKEKNEVAYKCLNTNCPAKIKESFVHFCEKDGLNIIGLGPKLIYKLVDLHYLNKLSDIFSLTEDMLSKLDKIGSVLSKKIIESIQEAKDNVTLSSFITALGIPHVGKQTAILLAHEFGDMYKLMDVTKEELMNINTIGEETANEIVKYFSIEDNKNMLQEFYDFGLWPEDIEEIHNGTLSGKKILFTGTLSIPRSEAEKISKDNGAIIANSVSKNLDYLVVGEKAGSKLDKAKKLNVAILTEDEWKDLCNVN